MGQQVSLPLPIATAHKYGCVPITDDEEHTWASKTTDAEENDGRLAADTQHNPTQQEVGKDRRLLSETKLVLNT